MKERFESLHIDIDNAFYPEQIERVKKNAEKIAVIGPNAQNEPMMWGNYNGTPNHTITILDGIKAKQKKLVYLPGCDLTYDYVKINGDYRT